MTRRYFYTDPMAAAWMNQHHKVRVDLLEPANNTIAASDDAIFTGGDQFIDMEYLDLLRWAMEDCAAWKFQIHPESLHLLEPQIHDVVSYLFTSEPDYFASAAKRTKMHLKSVTKGKLFSLKARNMTKLQIIQRCGKPFIWPESEEA
ncbi:hypothetical protein [Zavarzinella formosa]|uniref:hypothetical protein n=1 Tax=Zavarzinella formosa TaxID=360055 RepID=UPI0002E9E2D3|nr:hypothetical protein [Zavarzinella formosa]